MIRMTHYKVTGMNLNEEGQVIKTVIVSGWIKDGLNFLGQIFRRHADLRACSMKIILEKW